jgi:hypothetical protein
MQFFVKKWDHFSRGIPPAVASKGDLVFREKPKSPLDFIQGKFILVQPTGASDMRNEETWKSFLRVEAT